MAARRQTFYNVCVYFGLPAADSLQPCKYGNGTEREKNAAAFSAAGLIDPAVEMIDCELEIVDIELEREGLATCPLRKRSLPRLKWTSTKTDLIELLYALNTACCFNHGAASLNRIATFLGEMFGVDLSNFPRDFYEMRTRNDRTPFMDKLIRLLRKRMDDPKKPFAGE